MYSVYAQHWQRDTEAAASARVYQVSRLRHDAAPAPGVSLAVSYTTLRAHETQPTIAECV